jgi:hypothetical protein
VVSGYWNGDAYPDLAVITTEVDYRQSSVEILFGQKDGHFVSSQVISVGSRASMIVTGELNGDGVWDLAVLNTGDNSVSLLWGSRDGTFQLGSTLPVGKYPTALLLARLDSSILAQSIVTTNASDNTVSVYTNQGDGSFGSLATYATGKNPTALAFVKGYPRVIIVANQQDNTLSSLPVGIKGDLGKSTIIPWEGSPLALLAEETVSASGDRLAVGDSRNVLVLLSRPRGGLWSVQQTYAVPHSPWRLFSADVDNDGQKDYLIGGSGNLSIAFANILRQVVDAQTYSVSDLSRDLTVADIGGDRLPDVIVATGDRPAVEVLHGIGRGQLAAPKGLPIPWGPDGVVIADFTGDGRMDLAVATWEDPKMRAYGTVGLWKQGVDGAVTLSNSVTLGPPLRAIAIGDFNEDGRPDVATASWMEPEMYILLNRRGEDFVRNASYWTGSPSEDLAVADVNEDGHQDVVVACKGPTLLAVFLGNGQGEMRPGWTNSENEQATDVALRDMDHDGHLDIVALIPFQHRVRIIFGDGTGQFGRQRTFLAGESPRGMAVADFNGDTWADVAIPNSLTKEVIVLLGDGKGGLGPWSRYPAGIDGERIRTGDINGDGVLDLVVSKSASPISLLLGDGGGGFRFIQSCRSGNTISDLAVGDLNADSQPDLVSVSRTGGELTLFSNESR